MHRPLPEQYIWTRKDSVPASFSEWHSWESATGDDLSPHYFRRTFVVISIPAHATLYLAGPREATIYLNGKLVGHYQLNLDFPMGIQVYEHDVIGMLQPGKNVLAIQAVRGPDRGAGAVDALSMQQQHGEVLAAMIIPAMRGVQATPLVMSDGQWKATMQSERDDLIAVHALTGPGWTKDEHDPHTVHIHVLKERHSTASLEDVQVFAIEIL